MRRLAAAATADDDVVDERNAIVCAARATARVITTSSGLGIGSPLERVGACVPGDDRAEDVLGHLNSLLM
jgi:hypothetical protein